MASIDNRNGNSGVSRRAQQEYQQKEQSLIKKHHREVKRLTEDHRRKTDQLLSENDKKMDSMRLHSRKNLSERDQKYQNNIQEVQDIHRGQLVKLANENEKKLESVTRSKDLEFDKMKTIAERQKDLLRSQQKGDLEHMETRFNELADRTRKEQLEQRAAVKSKVAKDTNKVIDSLNQTHDEKLSAVHKDLGELKRHKDSEEKRLEKLLVSQKQELSDRHLDQIRFEQRKNSRALDERKVAFSDSIDRVQDKYQGALNKELVRGEEFRGDLREQVEGSHRDKVRVLEGRVAKLKLDNTAGFQNLKRQYEHEKKNLINANKRQMEIFDQQKQEALKAYNKTNHEDISSFQKQQSDMFRENNLFHMSRMEDLERRHAEQLDALISDSQKQLMLKDTIAEKRVRVIKDKTANEMEKQSNYFQSSIQEAKTGFQEQISDQRQMNTAEKQAMIKHFQKQMHKFEEATSQKLYNKIAEYEKRIQETNDQHLTQLRGIERHHQRLLKQKDRQTAMQQETLKSQFQDKVTQLQETNRRELQRMSQVHQDELQKLALATRKS